MVVPSCLIGFAGLASSTGLWFCWLCSFIIIIVIIDCYGYEASIINLSLSLPIIAKIMLAY